MNKFRTLVVKFLCDKKGTPSIETVAIVAFIALVIFGALGGLGDTISGVFQNVTEKLQNQIN